MSHALLPGVHVLAAAPPQHSRMCSGPDGLCCSVLCERWHILRENRQSVLCRAVLCIGRRFWPGGPLRACWSCPPSQTLFIIFVFFMIKFTRTPAVESQVTGVNNRKGDKAAETSMHRHKTLRCHRTATANSTLGNHSSLSGLAGRSLSL